MSPKTEQLNEMIYVCVISQYNLPEFESCLLHKPKHLILIVSDYEKIRSSAKLFEQTIKQAFPSINIIRPDKQQAFSGDDFIAIQQWFDRYLTTALDSLPDFPRVCNLTGGTKIMTLSLLAGDFNWRWLEYKANNAQNLQQITYQQKQLAFKGSVELPVADPIAVASLYSEHVRQEAGNNIVAHPESVALSEALWNGLEQQDTALSELFVGLAKVWAHGRGKSQYQKKFVTLSSTEFIGHDCFNEAQLYWLKQWAQLKPEALQVSRHDITFAGNKNMREELRRWLSGDWLERLVVHWLEEQIPAPCIAMNLKVRPENEDKSSIGERETDVIVHHKGRTTLIEVKTNLPPQQKMADLLRQLSSLTDRFGRTAKVLFIGPQLSQQIQPDLERIKMQCKAENIQLAQNRQQLLACLGYK